MHAIGRTCHVYARVVLGGHAAPGVTAPTAIVAAIASQSRGLAQHVGGEGSSTGLYGIDALREPDDFPRWAARTEGR